MGRAQSPTLRASSSWRNRSREFTRRESAALARALKAAETLDSSQTTHLRPRLQGTYGYRVQGDALVQLVRVVRGEHAELLMHRSALPEECPDCHRPIRQGDQIAVDRATGRWGHARCVIGEPSTGPLTPDGALRWLTEHFG